MRIRLCRTGRVLQVGSDGIALFQPDVFFFFGLESVHLSLKPTIFTNPKEFNMALTHNYPSFIEYSNMP